jgi:peptidyl-dipeptidase A
VRTTRSQRPTATDARQFLDTVNDTMKRLEIEQNQADWVQKNFITDDTEALQARVNQRVTDAIARFAKESAKFDHVDVAADRRRQLNLLKLSLVMVTPSDPKEGEELTTIMARLESTYGKGKWCADPAKPDACLNIDGVTKVMSESRDAARLRQVWEGWHTIAPPMRKDYARFVELSNKGAKDLGFADTGAMWRAKYDMPPDAFMMELDRLWGQVRRSTPLAVTRCPAELREKLRATSFRQRDRFRRSFSATSGRRTDEHLPARRAEERRSRLLHSPTSQTARCRALGWSAPASASTSSLGFRALPKTFWERSLFVRPKDREVVWPRARREHRSRERHPHQDVHRPDDEDFTTIHHELGHELLSRAYWIQPVRRDSANDGFHEAIGDTIALSVTPEYL